MVAFLENLIALIESHPVTTGIMVPVVGAIGGLFIKYLVTKQSPYVSSVRWGRFRITDVAVFVPSNEPAGYQQLSYPRPDLWDKVVHQEPRFMGLRHRIVPFDGKASVVVWVRVRDKTKQINFNWK
jgi:hypothetical protein